MPFVPHTDADVEKMLGTIGVESIDQLFDEIPEHLRAKPLAVPAGLSEMEMMRRMNERAQQDSGALCFIGAGAYEHHVPAAVWDVTTRGEFMTAYTPYQAEASQGTLQLIYEYQSMMSALTDMDVSNASLYDGASGLAEAVLMAIRANRKSKSKKVLVAKTTHPLYRKAAQCIVENQGIMLDELAMDAQALVTDQSALAEYEGQDYAALVISQPNFFGSLEQVDALTDWAHAQGMLVIAVVNPTALAVLTPPGQWGETGADIAVGEGQPLGVPLASGGPYFGFICCTNKLVRQMPGRIIGKTVDTEGVDGYALTLQAREQHIRRSKATSNICTNQGLAVTAATIYMSLLGAEGLSRVAANSHSNTQSLAQSIEQLDGVTLAKQIASFHERVALLDKSAEQVLAAMANQQVLGGIDLAPYYPELGNAILFCATETKTQTDLDKYRDAMQQALLETEAV
ncbi:glycine dehydrogenase [Oleiphilus sp. HI0009]|uniref:aminomethyl-transferring glycine dehydrogenase subunit GcvPA n=1 Tax=unclassified Oleiphilus TaxID=2631174 RepID=UPI0007C3EFC0|nr:MULTISPECIES: aminomethyl-transferring glycine dehydrogenase subunit GcvPA [unclassified Oleiphilus]KZX84210.1 glycine dehydrogenase [Oleiphilus sp. HI0009]KZY64187.1 glycine dehydrogenase [Oleiphilus sp. HI0066]KZY70306.1 glycine dehydrogenase [Oleiphilus sp. HI0067]KZZ60139.1 glycine dehydrogenase [Oleiphilus sp. HI0125]